MCPDGVSKPPGRSIRIQAEMNALVQRIDELSTMVQKLGGSLPPKLVLEFAGKGAIAVAGGSKEGEAKVQGNGGGPMGPSEGDSAMHDDEEDEEEEESLLSQGVGSLSIRDEDGRTRFLGVSAGSAYYFKVSSTCSPTLGPPQAVVELWDAFSDHGADTLLASV